jgi:hypothetical protein
VSDRQRIFIVEPIDQRDLSYPLSRRIAEGVIDEAA